MPTTLIRPREALKILTWVRPSGLYSGAGGTSDLTRYPVGKSTLYSKEECEALRDKIIENGIPPRRQLPHQKRRESITELI